MNRLLRLALTLPPQVVARRAAAMVANRLGSAWGRRRDRRIPTWAADNPGPLRPLLPAWPAGLLEPHRGWILAAARRFAGRRFDLLGSGWVEAAHGMMPAGVEGHRYHPAADECLPPSARAESRRLRALLSPGHVAVDWHRDLKSGWRWREDCWYRDIAIGHRPGVDVKVPWELGRLHHLTTFALAETLEGGGRWGSVFRDHVLDFLAANPPRFGVNWRCTMDVGIRAANLVLAWELMRVAGARFDTPFASVFARSLLEHARHIRANLEWYPEGRGNHYLANVCGLAFAAWALPDSAETAAWRAFAARELANEVDWQFLPDGSNFEASTCYHRLSAEMVAMTAALLAGQDRGFALPAGRLAAMAAFTRGVTKPSGRVAQLGDNDSGRFFKLHPAYDAGLDEDDLDHRALLGAIGSLLDDAVLTAAAGPFTLDAWLARALAGRAVKATAPLPAAPHTPLPPAGPGRRVEIVPGGSGLADGIEALAWPDFGFYLLRSPRLWLGLRCGAIGQKGRGGHAHNDQLGLELCLDGQDWLADPGTYLYTPLPEWRDRYRSAAAHAVPRWPGREPGRLDLGLFWLGNEAQARCLAFGPAGFLGEHHGYGTPVRRHVAVADNRIVVTDSGLPEGETSMVCATMTETRKVLGGTEAFSPGYGKR